MRAALAQVRAEQGADAVILSSRRSEDGIEVIAAVDYDEALFVEANRQRFAPSSDAPIPAPTVSPDPVAAPVRAQPAPTRTQAARRDQAVSRDQAPTRDQASERAHAPAVAAASNPTTSRKPIPASFRRLTMAASPAAERRQALVPGAAAADRAEIGLGAVLRELEGVRQLPEAEFGSMPQNDKRVREPLKARVFEQLSAMDIAPDVATALAAQTPQRSSLEDPSLLPLALLVRHLAVVDPIEGIAGVSGGIMAVVGPTGAGKTTTIAKLAARWCMQHGSDDLALVSTDGYRVGAREQLTTYARILGAPMYAANSGMELARVLERLKSKKLILIDTAGMGLRDVRMTEQLAALQLGAARARVVLALPAQGEGHALEEIVQAYARVTPSTCILTKVDEAASLGAVISTVLRHKLKIAYICDGQRVPEDLHQAHPKRIWLVRAALGLKSHAPRRGKTHDARHGDGAHAHA
jgi:flagellar biosynthesis protein FlhF